MKITSESFNDNDSVPGRNAFGIPDPDDHMALGGNLNPQLSWSDVPVEACSLILFCIDPDVPSSADDVNQEGKVIPASLPRVDFFHWIMVDLPASDDGLAEGECSQEVTPGGKVNPAGCKQLHRFPRGQQNNGWRVSRLRWTLPAVER